MPSNMCEKCGATLQSGARQCPYCQTTTPYGMQAQQNDIQQQQWSQAQAQQALLHAQLTGGGQIEAAATAALLWSLASIVFFCIPIPAIAGVVMGLRARSLAQSLRLSAPVRGTIGLVISALSGVGFLVFMVWAVVSSRHDVAGIAKRKAELETQIGSKASAATLDQSTACAMAELKILSEGHEGSATYFQEYECLGKVAGTGERATLEAFQYRTSSTGALKKVIVCFKHDAKWYVDEVRDEGKCAGDDSPRSVGAAASAPSAHVGTAASASHRAAGDASAQVKSDAGSTVGTPSARDAGPIRR